MSVENLQGLAVFAPLIAQGIAGISNIAKSIKAAKDIGVSVKVARDAATMGNLANLASLASAGIGITDSLLFKGLTKNDSLITAGGDGLTDLASAGLAFTGPGGMLVSLGLQGAKFLGHGIRALGGGTDLMTTTDKIFDTGLISAATLGMNGFFGKTTSPFSIDKEVSENIGGDYTGTMDIINRALGKSGKKYGFASSGSRRSDERFIKRASLLQNKMQGVWDDASWRNDVANSMNSLQTIKYQNLMNGGHGYVSFNKKGNKLQKVRRLKYLKKPPTWKPDIIFEIPDRSLEELIVYAKEQNPRFILRMSESPRHIRINKIDEEGNTFWESVTHLMTNKNKDVYPLVQEIDGKLLLLNDEEAYKKALESKNILKFNTNSEAKNFAENYKQGWKQFFDIPIEESIEDSSIDMYKEGGTLNKKEETLQKNVIPDGALHAHKHHMEDSEGLTQKGIPVVDNEGEQQAEIEREEIVFNLEITKLLESLRNKFNKEDLSQKEKDEIAIEAGKLLVEQILHNTDDRAKLIEKIE